MLRIAVFAGFRFHPMRLTARRVEPGARRRLGPRACAPSKVLRPRRLHQRTDDPSCMPRLSVCKVSCSVSRASTCSGGGRMRMEVGRRRRRSRRQYTRVPMRQRHLQTAVIPLPRLPHLMHKGPCWGRPHTGLPHQHVSTGNGAAVLFGPPRASVSSGDRMTLPWSDMFHRQLLVLCMGRRR